MRMVYTHENSLLVGSARNLLESEGLKVVVRNEFASGAMGELSPLDTWAELWVLDDADYEKAHQIIANALSDKNARDWTCSSCGEQNGASFEVCWQCGNES